MPKKSKARRYWGRQLRKTVKLTPELREAIHAEGRKIARKLKKQGIA